MKIKYFGHSCFKIEENGYCIVIDPFKNVNGYCDVKTVADTVLCSHDHFDHNAVGGVKRAHSGAQNPFAVTMMQTYHDKVLGKERGENTVHIIEAGGQKIVHLGDLGHLLSERQLNYIKNCDCLMVPIGGVYTVDADEAWETIRAVNPRIAVPMHYRNGKFGFENIGSLAEFTSASDRKVAVSLAEYFELPEEDNLLIVPSSV